MTSQSPAQEVLEYEFLPLRAKILEIAAALDRLQRAGHVVGQTRHKQVRAAIELLLDLEEGRAERIQLLLSRPYDHEWRATFQLTR